MVSQNYCRICGHRILPDEPYCNGCGNKTGYDAKNTNHILIPPIHNIGFFNFQIDFSPYIITKNDFKYEICSCGYLNDIDNDYCYMCGAKRSQSKISRIFKGNTIPKFSVDNVYGTAFQEGIKVVCRSIDEADPGLFCGPGDMRRVHAARRTEKGIVRQHRLD